ncbi:MAG: hybrid sensor histidine kinase/response regulator [Anaerolineae bacterium]|nr:hybrid sensor histidine kinase/response regulator [Anaerolineae bacterium]
MVGQRNSGAQDAESIGELVRSTQATLAIVALTAGWVWLFVAASLAPDAPTNPGQARSILPPAVLLSASLIYLLRRRMCPYLGSLLLLSGVAGAFLLGCRWTSPVVWPYYLSLVVIVAGLLAGSASSFAAALVLTLALLLLPRPTNAPRAISELLGPIGLLWAVALTSWLSSRNLYTTLRWALQNQEQVRELLEGLRQRQGELNRTLAALTEATRRLERTNRELAIARQRAEEARAMKEHFVANVSHELRTPLNVIVGFSEMMYLDPDAYDGVRWTPELQSDIGELYRASRHLQSLVNDILDLSRIDAARLPMFRELSDLRAIVTEAIETVLPLLRQRGLACHTDWPDQLPELFADRTRIRQVMLNLLNNAARFTDHGHITVAIRQTDDAVVVSVSDTGVGIPEDKLEAIFEEFHQVDDGPRRRGGAGLGLALSRQLVELHGGRMWAESRLGEGSTFHFTLPLPGALPHSAPLVRVPERKRDEVRHAPVVVVDPDPTIAEMLSRYLGDRRLLTATSPAEAEALVEAEHPLAVIVNEHPDAPPEQWLGSLGPATARHSVPIFRCSIPSQSWLGRQRGLDDCLKKPVSREVVRAALARFCPGPGTVLIVDDNPGFANLMARLITASEPPRRVLTAYNGAEALRLAREVRPDLVVLDLLLPDMHGFAVLDELHAEPNLSHTRVLGVTATSYAEEALLYHGAHFTLTQPNRLSTGTFAELLNAALQVVRPDYLPDSGVPNA